MHVVLLILPQSFVTDGKPTAALWSLVWWLHRFECFVTKFRTQQIARGPRIVHAVHLNEFFARLRLRNSTLRGRSSATKLLLTRPRSISRAP